MYFLYIYIRLKNYLDSDFYSKMFNFGPRKFVLQNLTYNLKESLAINQIHDDRITSFTFKNQNNIFNLKLINHIHS